MTISEGSLASADEVLNNCVGTPFRNYAQSLYNQALIGFNSKLNVATGVPNLKNIKYDCMLTDTATQKGGFQYDSTDKLYKYLDYYVIVEATSLSGAFTDYNTVVEEFDTGKWIIYSTTGTSRDNVLKALFYGSDGSNPRILNFTAITSLKSSDADDVGKRAYYFTASGSTVNADYIGTFADTSTNTNLFWFASVTVTAGGGRSTTFEMPNGTAVVTTGSGTVTGSGTQSNPATCALSHNNPGSGYMASGKGIVVCKGAVSWANPGVLWPSVANTDFYTTHSIPLFTQASDLDTEGIPTALIFQTTSLPTIKDCISTWNASIDSDNTLTVSISADGTNYEEVTDATIHRFTDTGTNLYVKFEIDRVDTTAVDKISEYAILYNITGETA